MTKKPTNIPASVQARLLQLARDRSEDFQLVLVRYVNERLLARLAASPYAERFVLKGATLFTIWTGQPHRATRDIDLLGFGDPDQNNLLRIFTEVVTLDVENDGVTFDLSSLASGSIRDDQLYGGVRLELTARIVSAQVRVQVDIGFGDAITPEAAMVDLPSMLGFPSASMRAYPRETVVAEKLEAAVQLGMANSRMKDFYDLAILAKTFNFDGETLAQAILATFNRRNTPVPTRLPIAFTAIFADDAIKNSQWGGFVKKTGIHNVGTLHETIATVAAFVESPLLAACASMPFNAKWSVGGPWR